MTKHNNSIPNYELFVHDSNLIKTDPKMKTREKITFPHPNECQDCGSFNYRITGVIYNGDKNYYDLKVKCMRCGKIETHLNSKKF